VNRKGLPTELKNKRLLKISKFVIFQKGESYCNNLEGQKEVNFCPQTVILLKLILLLVDRRMAVVLTCVPLCQNVTQHTCLVLIEQIIYECSTLRAERLSNGGNTFFGFYLILQFAMRLFACVKVPVTNL